MPRLDKILSDTGLGTRSGLRQLIRSGRVEVGGAAVTDPCFHCEYTSEIRVDGALIQCAKYFYIMLNKPAGVISATEDRAETTVLDLLPEKYRRLGVAPVGRLDKDSEGLMLLTNDGSLSHKLTAPSKNVPKVYFVCFDGVLTGADIEAFGSGIEFGSGERCLPAKLDILSPGEAKVTITEGKFHQVKRMFAARGCSVTYLRRLSIGSLTLDALLAPGDWRQLYSDELRSLTHERA